jgi:hypothetical protein
MRQKSYCGGRIAAALVVAVLLSLPGAAFAQSGRPDWRSNRSSMYGNYVTGTVQSVNRGLNYVTVRDQSGRDVKIDVRSMDARSSINVWQLRPGDRVAANGGWENRDTFQARSVSYSTYRSGTNAGSDPNALFGTVQSVNRKLNYLTIRDQDSGRDVKIDLRRLDSRQSVNAMDLRAGDPIVINGGWTDQNTFRANRINISSVQSMDGGYGSANTTFVSGTVEGVNRNLNYITVRNDATGQVVKIDVRRMDTRRSVNAWQLRAGDRIAANGSWSNGDTFQADTINF